MGSNSPHVPSDYRQTGVSRIVRHSIPSIYKKSYISSEADQDIKRGALTGPRGAQ